MSNNRLPELIAAGQELLTLFEQEDVQTAEQLIEHYLILLDAVFQHIQPHVVIDMEHQQALVQFQTLHERIEHAKNQTETALWKLSKAGRASDMYKLNAG
ncbi:MULTISPECIES: hypothetical protein [Aeromonas]|uniref:hypothetical protein n=1 Tax=Aeromonas TaxID=642 RepID=UPI000F8E8C52|nr:MULTISPECIES: hypothetical protein [Aeromonas]MEE1952752.1 hypothetical protein [Aeromonas sp. 43P]RUR54863.1 hypothetical protein ELS78_16685 [Aeromonas veronii]